MQGRNALIPENLKVSDHNVHQSTQFEYNNQKSSNYDLSPTQNKKDFNSFGVNNVDGTGGSSLNLRHIQQR